MVKTRMIMGMPVILDINSAPELEFEKIFSYFDYVDQKFSTYKLQSEIMKINRGEIPEKDWSADMKEIFALSEKTKHETDGFFEIKTPKGDYDPSGMVKGWAILNAAKKLHADGFKDFKVDAGGDMQVSGKNHEGKKWRIGILNPFNPKEFVKVVYLSNEGIATSGTYIRGQHIWNPKSQKSIEDIVSLTVIGPDIMEADRFATAAFAMGKEGINLIEKIERLEGYMIDKNGTATMTSGFEKYAHA